jgi:hypothetical protein
MSRECLGVYGTIYIMLRKYGLPPHLDICTKVEIKVKDVFSEQRRVYCSTWGIMEQSEDSKAKKKTSRNGSRFKMDSCSPLP